MENAQPADAKPVAPPASAPAAPAPVESKAPEAGSILGGEAKQETAPKAETPAAPTPIDIKLPENFQADAAAVDGFKKLAAESGLDSAKAQKFFDSYVALEQSRAQSAEQAFAKQEESWLAELKADKEFGGPHFDATVKSARRGMELVGRDAQAVIAAAGLGNHPALVKAFARIGKANAEDSVASTTQAAGSSAEPGWSDVMYPTMKSKER